MQRLQLMILRLQLKTQLGISMFSNRLNKPGYAIAEVLLAMVIISISFLQLSQSLGNIMDAAKENIFVTRAVNFSLNSIIPHYIN